MKKFEVVEGAFKNIKLATGVTNAESIVSKFINRESVYGKLLDAIVDKEKRI